MKPYDDRENYGKNGRALFISTKKQYKFAQDIIKSGSVLDVGAGFCALEEYLPDEVTYKAIDATEWVCNLGGAEFKDVMDYTSPKVDFVVAFGVLETAPDVKALADKLKSIAKLSVLFSFTTNSDNEIFKAYTNEEIVEAFGKSVIIVESEGENYARYDL